MKKAAILTWCNNNGPTNYGQILQCYAMQYLVRQAGYEPTVIQYRKKKANDFWDCYFSNRTAVGRWLNERYEARYHEKIVEGGKTLRLEHFRQFIKENINLSAPCYNKEMVEQMTADCELLVCGSDQIWNPIWFDPIWFLDFGTKAQKRIAYAPSGIFHDKPEYQNVYREMANLLKRLDKVTLRERSGIEILQKYTDIPMEDAFDPVCLVPVEEWNRLAAERLVQEEYIFCYVMGSLRPYQLILRELMKKYNAGKVVYIPSNMLKEPGFAFTESYDAAGPAEFLSLIKHAKAVCTDSFHGVVVSLLYQKPFYNVQRKHAGTEAFGGSERVNSLLKKLGVEKMVAVECVKDLEKREEKWRESIYIRIR